MQTAPVYGVQKGALSVSTAPFNALAASNSQHTYQILVPSLNVFVDRKVVWESGVYLQSLVYPTLPCDPLDSAYNTSAPYVPSSTNLGAGPGFGGSSSIDVCSQADPKSALFLKTLPANAFPTNGVVPSFPSVQGEYYEVLQPGANFNLCPFPLQSLCNSMTCSINDCSVTTNGDTLQEQILLTNTRDTQRIRTTPSKFDQYGWTLDDYQSDNGNMSTLNVQRPAVGEIPTGAWPITFYNPNNAKRLSDDPNNCGAYLDPTSKSAVYYINGRPIVVPGGILRGCTTVVPAGSGALTVEPDATGGGVTGMATFEFSYNGTYDYGASYTPGCLFTITGLTGTEAIWNGYYSVLTVFYNYDNGTAKIKFRYGAIAFASGENAAVSFVSRGSVTSIAGKCFLTSEKFSQSTEEGYLSGLCALVPNNNASYVSKLLGQILPNGVQIMPTPMNVPFTTSFRYDVAEPIIMSPFIYQDALEFNSVGLYGCTNIQFTMNIQQPSPNCQVTQQSSWPATAAPWAQVRTNCDYPQGANLLRCTGSAAAFSNVQLAPPSGLVTTTGAFYNPRMVVQFLTPGPDISLPLISNVPYMEFPRYTNTYQLANPNDPSPSIQSQTITLSSIPDFIMVYVKARTRCQLQNETYYPISKVAVTFDNFSNLCSNMTPYELYTCSVAAGLDMDYHTWRGFSNASSLGARASTGLVGNGLTGGGSGGGAIDAVTVTSAAGVYTYTVVIDPVTTAYPIPVGATVTIYNGTGAMLPLTELTFAVTSSTSTSFTFKTTIAPGEGGGGGLFVAQGPALGATSTFAPITSGSWNQGGSLVPWALSSSKDDLWPVASGLYNVAGQNKLVCRPTTQLTGGPLLLRMGQDISLSPGLAPGTLGNFSIQLNLTLDNSQHFFDAYTSYQMTIVAVNSGYFETVRGQSAVRKTILNMADVESASVASGVTTAQLRRLVGGARGHSLSGLHPYVSGRSSGMEGGAYHKRRNMGGGSGL